MSNVKSILMALFIVGALTLGAFAEESTASESADIKALEARIEDFAQKNNLSTERDEQNHLLVKDANGNVVPLPPFVLGRNGPPNQLSEKELSIVKAAEADIEAYAKEKGYTVKYDNLGRIFLTDADGKRIRYPAKMVPINKVIEYRLGKFAEDKGYATERDSEDRLLVKDKDGNLVRLPPGLLPPAQVPPFVQMIEDKIRKYAEEKGYTVFRDENGRLGLKDANGNTIPTPKEVFPPKADDTDLEAPSNEGSLQTTTDSSTDTTTDSSSETAEDNTDKNALESLGE